MGGSLLYPQPMTAAWIDDLERIMTGDQPINPADLEYATPGDLAQAIDSRITQTPALRKIDEFLVRIANTPDGRGIVTMPPQEGKSQRATRAFCTWSLKRNPNTRIGIGSYESTVARRWGRAIRDDIRDHPDKLGLHVRRDLSAQAEWQLAGHDGGVVTVGIGGALTGRALDLLVIDDPVKDRAQADSEAARDAAWDWWTDVASTRLSPGASVILILTRWHEDDLAGRLLNAPDGAIWQQLHIPAQADHNPAKGETDALGREPGEYLESARGRTDEQWEAIKVRSGSRTWASLYQGRPAPAGGRVFNTDWWRYYDVCPWVERDDGSRVVIGDYDEMIASWDMTFKDTDGTDYVVGQVWLKRNGAEAMVLDQVRGRWDFPETRRRFKALAARWPQAVLKLVEDKANGPAIIASLQQEIPGIVPEEPHGSKTARADAVAPFVEAGNVLLPDPQLRHPDDPEGPPIGAWAEDLITEAAAFPNGAHDDQVDALTQALNRLLLIPLLDGSIVTIDDLEPDLVGFRISPY